MGKITLLIRPEWNWNKIDAVVKEMDDRAFNQTRMELKQEDMTDLDYLPSALLIRPEWNWNYIAFNSALQSA